MKFHNVHGIAVTLSDNRSVATRSEATFYHGIVFGDQPIKLNQKVCLELTTITLWSGALRVGVTTNDPNKLSQNELPRYALPGLVKREGFWIRPVSEGFINSGSKLTLYVSSQGQLQLFVDNVHKGCCLNGLTTEKPLWLCLDLYGNTKSAKFVKPDDAPKEILARGPEAVHAYEEACTSGTRPVFCTRLMLVGQDGVGKTSLKKALMGQRHDVNEESTGGIDLSASCSFNISKRSQWQRIVKGENENEAEISDNRKKLGIIGGPEGLEEEYHQALAENIVKEMSQIKLKQRQESSKTRTVSRDSIRSRNQKNEQMRSMSISRATPGSSHSDRSSVVYIPPDLISQVPDRVVQLVQEMLEQQQQGSEVKQVSSAVRSSRVKPEQQSIDLSVASKVVKENKVVLNIWDFAGQTAYFTTHQVFLTSRAVYMIVFNLCQDLNAKGQTGQEQLEIELCTLDYMDFWMRCIFAHASQNSSSEVDNTRLSPPFFIVGTHRNSLSPDPEIQNQMVEEKFEAIRSFLMDKPYTQHIVTPFFAVENSLQDMEDPQIDELRKQIELVASKEAYMGEQMPIKWLKFEHEVANHVQADMNHATFDQVREIAGNLGITDDKEVKTMLEFYHDLGVLVYYGGTGTMDNLLRNTVILKPQWLIDMFKPIIMAKQTKDKWSMLKEKWRLLEEKGILEEALIDYLWKDVLGQKIVLLGLMEKFDLITQRLPHPSVPQVSSQKSKSFYIPCRLSSSRDTEKRLYVAQDKDVVFYVNFCGFLPDGLFHRIMTRTIRWCLENAGKEPYSVLGYVARFYLDQEHDFVLEMAPRQYHRIKVIVMRVAKIDESDSSSESDDDEDDNSKKKEKQYSPNPAATAKLRNFLESTLYELKETWMRRLTYSMCVSCPCGKPCYLHDTGACLEEECLHFLNLDECLANRVVCCDHRRIKTTMVKRWFPEPPSPGFHGKVLPSINLDDAYGNIEKHNPQLPTWVKGAAKLLNTGSENQDWLALAKLMDYNESQIEKFSDDLNPSLALLADWIITSGNTTLSVDMLIGYLEKLDREDVVEIIQMAKDTDLEPQQIFISYQWDHQDEVKALRDKLEKSGFSCWMDIGQMGGGDQLNAKIDQGIRNCKVCIACISPKYVVSHHCNRELSLADTLTKPIIPVMFSRVTWPPPGGMSLIFSQLVYIDMKGVGGHGGTGIHADLNDKYKEVIQKVMNYATPDLSRYFDTVTISSSKPPSNIDDLHSLSSESFMDIDVPNNTARTVHHANVQGMQQAVQRHVILNREEIEQPHFPPQQVQVTRCGLCSIL